MKEKIQKEINDLFAGKVRKAVSDELKAVSAVRKERAELAERIRVLEVRAQAAGDALVVMSDQIDRDILDNKLPAKLLREAEVKSKEVKACTGQISLLKDRDAALAIHEKQALEALSGAAWKACGACHEVIEARARALLDEALLLLATYEDAGLRLFKDQGIDLRRDKELTLGRFGGLQPLMDDLESFALPSGQEMAFIDRREIRHRALGG